MNTYKCVLLFSQHRLAVLLPLVLPHERVCLLPNSSFQRNLHFNFSFSFRNFKAIVANLVILHEFCSKSDSIGGLKLVGRCWNASPVFAVPGGCLRCRVAALLVGRGFASPKFLPILKLTNTFLMNHEKTRN